MYSEMVFSTSSRRCLTYFFPPWGNVSVGWIQNGHQMARLVDALLDGNRERRNSDDQKQAETRINEREKWSTIFLSLHTNV